MHLGLPSLTAQPHEMNQLESCPLPHLEFVHGKRVAVSICTKQIKNILFIQ